MMLCRFTTFDKGNNFYAFMFAFVHKTSFEKEFILYVKNLPLQSKFFPFRIDPLSHLFWTNMTELPPLKANFNLKSFVGVFQIFLTTLTQRARNVETTWHQRRCPL